ncbi:3,4-dihydroxy 2-butanone 4-phosphate synthase/GTP cyclohydrolase II [Parabacteroides sp. PFB2-12]|uniref:bifunctional 3,4-dihydroxy-2-butanone-4-phosphate synthase/GTP cyclohydrolase II n=1 Tax=unclassified Parabacteroides TaxID=2649774 RepID=UPI00247679F4|nr:MULTISPECIES: bifunctional 3,4-dihydroxy-2-butanone-4-phosphate synthase/GTP cyclohydrolase II [unclassified Parabacteroides]MDH6341446.1 3,4-dihydroxy 2-butanone 4-phosphate synthase/GTP cyclohydrolase II [Parabacteroides sp. PM6-13]MDH6389240.1 3,4-dihydroxy 2-butanone 4-phosphate synthase/GTP cyclohydrolase II [Parabacteroides sp. PFB2-12]MDL2309786.1 bifunctional 3,4-dihydroxy-2-butanone-4-phosphate synthase/GTP cyclohydrolase II [Parabacteroides sp. OttesenSCG-928-B22]
MNEFKLNTIEEAIEDFREGKFLIVVDDEDRENEGDFIIAAEKITPEKINFMMSEGRGLLCAPITEERCQELELEMQAQQNTSMYDTPFTVTVDKIEGCTTGVSMHDRAQTILALANPETKPTDLARPGHISPLRARSRGVLRRSGHTEATVDLARLAGLYPAGALIEIINPDGTMARLPDLIKVSQKFGIKIITIKDLIAYRLQTESIVEKGVEVDMPTEHGHFRLIPFRQKSNGLDHIALIKGEIKKDEPILVRVHSSCATGDIFGSMRCECGEQLRKSMEMIEKEGEGVVVYLNQEGRGIGLMEKMKAYKLQENGLDTVDANLHLGHQADERDYGVGAQILRHIGVTKMRLMTNNPVKRVGLEAYGLSVVENVPIEVTPNAYNVFYLKTKKERMGHQLHNIK